MDIKRNGSQPSYGFNVTLMKLFAATVISLSLLASASAQTNQAGASIAISFEFTDNDAAARSCA